MKDYIDIVFDGPPGQKGGEFVEVEDSTGASIKLGEWIERDDGIYWALRIPNILQKTRYKFAGLALQGLLANPKMVSDDCEPKLDLGKEAVLYADALLKALEEPVSEPADEIFPGTIKALNKLTTLEKT